MNRDTMSSPCSLFFVLSIRQLSMHFDHLYLLIPFLLYLFPSKGIWVGRSSIPRIGWFIYFHIWVPDMYFLFLFFFFFLLNETHDGYE